MPSYKNNTTQTLSVATKDGKGDSIKAGEVKSLDLAEGGMNAGWLHAGALMEAKAVEPATRTVTKPDGASQIKPAQ